MASQYQIAGVSANLTDLMQKSNLQKQELQRATSKQMDEMEETFEDELEELQKNARDRTDKNKPFLKGVSVISKLFGTP